MNRLNTLFEHKKEDVLAVYFTAGYPNINDTATVLKTLSESGADIIEVGMPFSDPVADGPVIQQSSLKALKNGMSIKLLFSQLENIRSVTQVPIVLMGYLNPILQFGVEAFCDKCAEIGIDGLILPDLPPELYIKNYKTYFERNNLSNILLVTPQSSNDRIKQLDEWATGFLYVVSSSSTTGAKQGFEPYQIEYFERLQNLHLKSPRLIGFGISDRESYLTANQYAYGAIIGSAFIKALNNDENVNESIIKFMKSIKN